jgi:hypothetical protein
MKQFDAARGNPVATAIEHRPDGHKSEEQPHKDQLH